jgi:hypothetical protein
MAVDDSGVIAGKDGNGDVFAFANGKDGQPEHADPGELRGDADDRQRHQQQRRDRRRCDHQWLGASSPRSARPHLLITIRPVPPAGSLPFCLGLRG